MAGGWTWFTKQRRNIHDDNDDGGDLYPPLAPATNSNPNLKPAQLGYANAAAKGVSPNENSAGLSNCLMQDALSEAGGGGSPNSTVFAEEKVSEVHQAAQTEQSPFSEDDAHLRIRKESIKVSRLMSRHARAASNAYQRGDHHLAKQLSKQVHQEKLLVEKLNAEAAERILNLKNGSDPWKIDLHGLYSREAVQVLERKLVELEASSSGASSSSRYSEESLQFSQPTSASSFTDQASHEGLQPGELRPKLKLKPKAPFQRELTVITGTGVHSRDGPSLPNAVRNFLYANSYNFTEPHPGAVVVQLKLRRTR